MGNIRLLLRALCPLLLLPALITGDAAPDIQLAGFDDLFRLATAAARAGMAGREDRSLVNSYPFNQVGRQVPHGSPSDTSFLPPGHQSPHESESVISARAPSSQRSSLFHPSSADIQSQVQSTYANIKSQAGGPASSLHLEHQSPAPAQAGQALLAGYGSQLRQTTRQQQSLSSALAQGSSAASAAYSGSPARAPVQTQFSNFQSSASSAPVIPSLTVSADAIIVSDSSLSRGASQCPAAPSLPLQQCQGAVNACWSVGVHDVDCPGQGLCCFDGCATVCAGQARAAPRPALKRVRTLLNPQRRRNPAQRRRRPAGETFEDVAASGQRCIDKIEQVEEIEYDELEECHHSYDKKCHTSYSTEYESQREEECEDNYKKDCDITYSPHAQNVTA